MGVEKAARPPFYKRHKKKLIALVVVLLLPFITHFVLVLATPIAAPAITLPEGKPVVGDDGITRLGPSYARSWGGIHEIVLQGTPEEIGSSHARLFRDRMIANEQELWDDFSNRVPFGPLRTLLIDLGRLRYRHVDRGMPEPRRRELAAEAAAFAPDPYEGHLPSYHRMVFLHALYDIALSFEHSPLIGCSAFALGPGAVKDGHVLMGRAFDFEAGDVFDRDKAVFFVHETDPEGIPFASVAWPGLVGVMTGMNAEGVAVIVNGARAGEPQAEGLPVLFSLRGVLERARSTAEAVAILRDEAVMVAHIVFVADAQGHFAVVERAPRLPAFVRDTFADPDRVGVTNHFEGPFATDPKNETVKATTTTLARRARLDEMLKDVGPQAATVESAVAMLRDHHCAGGVSCQLGDRRTIDALIATHGVVFDLTERALWVSAGPHLSGKFVRFDLRRAFTPDHDPAKDGEAPTLPEDTILHDGSYAAGRARAMNVGEGASR